MFCLEKNSIVFLLVTMIGLQMLTAAVGMRSIHGSASAPSEAATQGRARPAVAGPHRSHHRTPQVLALTFPLSLWTAASSPVDDAQKGVKIGYASHTIGAAAGRSATFCTHRPQHCAEAPLRDVQRQDRFSTSSTGAVMTARSIYFSFNS